MKAWLTLLHRSAGRLAPGWRASGIAMRVLGFSWCLLWIALLPAANAQIASNAFDAANRLYEQSKFSDAAAAYETLLKPGAASTALYFNLGNAYFKSGQVGRAISAYRRAEQLTPRDPDVRANLQFARNQVQGPTLAPGRRQSWLGRLSINEWTLLATTVAWLWFGLLILRIWRPGLKPALRSYIFFTGLAAVMLGIGCALVYHDSRLTQTAIVISSEAVIRQGPLEESNPSFTAHDGAELRVLDRKDDWLQVSPDPSRSGWVKRSQLQLFPSS